MLEVLEIVKNVQSNMYAKYGLKIKNFFPEEESSEYHAHTFTLKNKNGLFRIAKKTPTKTGWFVTIWKRGADNIIAPYDRTDAIDFVVIAVSDNNNVGEFIFPKTILLKKNIFSENGKEGKRAIRVYTPWDKTTSAQAAKTQKWQSQFFVDMRSSNSEPTITIKNLYSMCDSMNKKFPYKLIDLTHALDSTIPTWNGGCGFNHDVHIDYSDCTSEDKFRVMKVKMHAGIGTHMDAPSHCIPGGRFIHDFDVNDLIMPCVVIDVSDKCFERYSLSVQDIADFESKYGLIPKSSCVFVKTGWGKFWNEPLKYHNNHVFPSLSAEAAELLLERGVSAIGIDTLSPDRPEDGFKVHKTFLGADNIIIENVANLDSMLPTGSFCLVLPIKIKDGTEAPVRLVGLIERGRIYE